MAERGMIGKTIAHYRIDLLLGQGGMAAVYEATDTKLQRKVAIKVMHPHLASQKSFQQLFLQEARSAARLDHPNIVRVLSFDNIDHDLFLVMELVTGGNLRKYMKRLAEEGRFIDYPEAIELIRQVAEALDYAHKQGMVHRDIKPDNVVLKPGRSGGSRLNYLPILTDFGLARLTSTDENAVTDQEPIGTYPYMSPEQCLGQRVDHRTDIYALGVMLYELSVGRLPFNPKTIAEAARMHGQEAAPLPSSLRKGFPADLEKVIVQCLSKEADKRYQSAEDVVRALSALLHEDAPAPRAKVLKRTAPTAEESLQEYSTDLKTSVMNAALPNIFPDFERPPVTEDQEGFDRLCFYSTDQPIFAAKIDQEIVLIGRGKDQEVILQGDKSSRAHLRIERKPNGKYYIIDVGSVNGTWVDEQKLAKETPIILNPGTVVRLGEYWMLLELAEHPAEALPEAAPESVLPEQFDTAQPVEDALPSPIEQPVFMRRDAVASIPATEKAPMSLDDEPPRYSPPPFSPDQMEYDRLVFYSPTHEMVVRAVDQAILSIGRAKDRDIILSGRAISRRHARIEQRPDGSLYIIDMQSSNGTWVDNQRLEANQPTLLDPRKSIRLGSYWLRFERSQSLDVLAGEEAEEEEGALDTVAMVRPLAADIPALERPVMSPDQLANDRLVFFSEDHPSFVHSLDKETITIGRDPGQDVVLRGRRVSRSHARVEISKDGRLFVTDLGTENGVWVADTLLVPNTQVQWEPDEVVRIGNYWMKYERGAEQLIEAAGLDDPYGRVNKTIKNFRIDRFIGQTNISGVYKATEQPLERTVALKMLHPHLAIEQTIRQRFLQEARLISRLDHPNVIRVFSYDNVDNELFMVMELITGGSLRNLLNKLARDNRLLEYVDTIRMGVEMSDGLHYAHQQGLLHRDIRPESVVLRLERRVGPIETFQPVLTDFGLAQLTESGDIYITDKPDASFPYMSPEQCLSDRTDVRSDIYEMGVVLYEMSSGRPPHQPRSMAEAVRMHAREPVARLAEQRPNFPEELEKVILKCLEKDPNNRFQTAAELSQALQRASIGVAHEGIPSIGSLPPSIGELKTMVVSDRLPEFMPLATRLPSLEEREVDEVVIYSESEQTRAIPLKKDILTIGRGEDQDIRLDNMKVSTRHARIERGAGKFYRIVDLGSRNGTWLGPYKLVPNVAEIWDSDKTLRIGEYWLRIDPAVPAAAPAARPARNGRPAEEEEARPARKAVRLPPPEHDKIGVNVANSHLRVAAGSSVTMPLEIINQGDLVDHFSIELIGLPPEWVTQPVEPLYLLPNNRQTTSIVFHPPLASSSATGAHHFEVVITTRAQGIQAVLVQGSLTIEPFYSFTTDLEPERIRWRGRRSGRTELTIYNTGNTYATYTINGRDREQIIKFEMAGKQFTLPPGASEQVSMRVAPRNRHYFGRPQTVPFEVITTPAANEAGAPQSQSGELVVRAIFPTWLIVGAVISLILCGVIGFFGFTLYTRNIEQNQTITAIAMATNISATATATAMLDSDGDGLSNFKELEIQTDPNLPDTDEDGLNDGQENRVWLTNPLNRDSDGDRLTDGDEVNLYGTDPLSKDTDNDGIPDNEDVAPTFRSTPTITPFPTIEGSAGDICPGSPIPSRLSVGMDAVVEAGGVANRLRDQPGKQSGSIVGFMPPLSTFTIIGGPECDPDEQLRWWKVNFNGVEGWTAEGEGDEYYLSPPGEEGDAPPGDISVGLPPVAANPPLLPAKMGVQLFTNFDVAGWETVMASAQPLNVGWVKLQADWRSLEPDFAGQFDLLHQFFRSHIAISKQQGYKVLVSIAKAPDWARNIDRNFDGPPDDPQQLVTFLDFMLERYGSDIDAIEIWNEPNLRREWTGELPFSGEGYMQLFRPAYERIRRFSSSIIIITGGLAPTGDSTVSVDDRKYLRQMYEAGLSDFADVQVGIHPYGWANDPDARCCPAQSRGWDNAPQFFFLDNIQAYRDIQAEFGHSSAQLWTTEFGWATWAELPGEPPEAWMAFNTPETQSSYTVRAFQIGQSLDFMGPMFLWNLNFANETTVAGRNEIAAYSLLFPDSANAVQKRPLYNQLSSRPQS